MLVDLLAFDIDEPKRWWLRVGAGVILGSYWAEKADWLGEPLYLFGNPLSWLKAECQGAVILDWNCAAWRLAGVKKVIAETYELGCRIDKTFNRPLGLPEIRVREVA